jgi:CheY-like chemotaxis protein
MIKLLHVEDDADIREIALMALGLSGGFEVVQCGSGEEALIKVQHMTPDVFLLDLMMPGTSGTQALEAFREMDHLVHVPAIFMTARTRQSEQDALRAAGALAVISKPFDPLVLGDTIKATLQL